MNAKRRRNLKCVRFLLFSSEEIWGIRSKTIPGLSTIIKGTGLHAVPLSSIATTARNGTRASSEGHCRRHYLSRRALRRGVTVLFCPPPRVSEFDHVERTPARLRHRSCSCRGFTSSHTEHRPDDNTIALHKPLRRHRPSRSS